MRLHAREQYVHRAMYEQEVGPIPAGLFLDHLCRVTRCMNPAHLEPVTPGENARRGKNTKLTPERVRSIRASHLSAKELGELHGVTEFSIYLVRRGDTWADA